MMDIAPQKLPLLLQTLSMCQNDAVDAPNHLERVFKASDELNWEPPNAEIPGS